MINVVVPGKDQRRIFRFVCKQCGCVYNASEEEGRLIMRSSKTTFDPDFNKIGTNEIKELQEVGMELECPMGFCQCKNTSFDIINKDELERQAYYKHIKDKFKYHKFGTEIKYEED